MALFGEDLASYALLYQFSCLGPCGGLIKPGSENLADQGPRCCVMATHTGVNFQEDRFSFLLRYASLEHASDTAPVQFFFMDFVRLDCRTICRASVWSSGSSLRSKYARVGLVHGVITAIISCAEEVSSIVEP
jgi:hypothetical protein